LRIGDEIVGAYEMESSDTCSRMKRMMTSDNLSESLSTQPLFLNPTMVGRYLIGSSSAACKKQTKRILITEGELTRTADQLQVC
jgi:hypothetical protein